MVSCSCFRHTLPPLRAVLRRPIFAFNPEYKSAACRAILDLFLIDCAVFEIAAAIVDNELDIAAVHIQAVTTRPGFVDQGADFELIFFRHNRSPPQRIVACRTGEITVKNGGSGAVFSVKATAPGMIRPSQMPYQIKQ
jgi:hypothetical protein